jgi:hypothetical protein
VKSVLAVVLAAAILLLEAKVEGQEVTVDGTHAVRDGTANESGKDIELAIALHLWRMSLLEATTAIVGRMQEKDDRVVNGKREEEISIRDRAEVGLNQGMLSLQVDLLPMDLNGEGWMGRVAVEEVAVIRDRQWTIEETAEVMVEAEESEEEMRVGWGNRIIGTMIRGLDGRLLLLATYMAYSQGKS